MQLNLPRRQIHLDFHTSQLIDNIGSQFDSARFVETLISAYVDSVTCFARCHHGMLYYPSSCHANAVHPKLAEQDLLGKQIEACHKVGIKVPVYTTVQWDQRLSESYPQWCMRTKTGAEIVAQWSKPGYFEDGFYTFLCVNSPYREYLFEEVDELLERYEIDGLFFDILYVKPCYCMHCLTKMNQAGVDTSDEEAVEAFSAKTLSEFRYQMSNRIRAKKGDVSVYYNTSHVHPGYRQFISALSHIEVESLPSGGWGYDHFPVVGRYARTLGVPVVGMTGKFHTYWGDFHSLKTPEALQYECFLINAMGANVSVGDQMHPDGRLSQAGYELISSVFEQLKLTEPWCSDTVPVNEMAILNPEERQLDSDLNVSQPLIGATRVLQELGYQFDIIDSQHDFTPYKVLVLVCNYQLNKEVSARLNDYLSKGGKILASGYSPFDQAMQTSLVPQLCVQPKGQVPFSPDYILLREEKLSKALGLPAEELVMYQGSVRVEADHKAEVVADTIAPYFNRCGRWFCSHQHAPSSREILHPAIVTTADSSYFSHPVFSIYASKAPRWVRTLVRHQCDRLLGQPLIQHNGPHSLIATLHHQPEHRRYILHLLHYVPEKRCSDLLIVDAVLPVNQLNLRVNLAGITSVQTVLDNGKVVSWKSELDSVSIDLDCLMGYQLISMNYLAHST